MKQGPIVTVLHRDTVPDSDLMASVAERAVVRYTEAAGLADALRGADVLFVYEFLTRAVPDAWHAADRLRWLHMGATGVDRVMFAELRASDVMVTNTRGVFDSAASTPKCASSRKNSACW